MKPLKISPDNVFSAALDAESEGGTALTENEFLMSVAVLTEGTGRLTGALVKAIRQDWEELGKGQCHPATPEAKFAYQKFLRQFGALALLDLLTPRGRGDRLFFPESALV